MLLGDLIASITNFFGIKEKGDCGCTSRRRRLNAWDEAQRTRIKSWIAALNAVLRRMF